MSVHNNETQMLAGLLQRNERAAGSVLPGPSRVPFFDRIFGTRADDAHETELVLLLTPRIVRNQAVPTGNVVSFDSGTENRISTERDIVPGASARLLPPVPASPPVPVPPAPVAANAPVVALPPPAPPDSPPRTQP